MVSLLRRRRLWRGRVSSVSLSPESQRAQDPGLRGKVGDGASASGRTATGTAQFALKPGSGGAAAAHAACIMSSTPRSSRPPEHRASVAAVRASVNGSCRVASSTAVPHPEPARPAGYQRERVQRRRGPSVVPDAVLGGPDRVEPELLGEHGVLAQSATVRDHRSHRPQSEADVTQHAVVDVLRHAARILTNGWWHCEVEEARAPSAHRPTGEYVGDDATAPGPHLSRAHWAPPLLTRDGPADDRSTLYPAPRYLRPRSLTLASEPLSRRSRPHCARPLPHDSLLTPIT